MGAGSSTNAQKPQGSAFCGGCAAFQESDDEADQECYIMPQHKIDAVATWMSEVSQKELEKVGITHELVVPDTLPGTVPDEDATDEELGLISKDDVDAIRPPFTSDNLKRWLMYIHTRPHLH
jgi:hypothetical protein